MKKLFLLLVSVFTMQVAMADNDKPVTFEQLPQAAQAFIKQNFADREIAFAKVDKDWLDATYDVLFTNGEKLEFNKKGEWKEMQCKLNSVPEKALPAAIVKFVNDKYPGAKVISIEKDRYEYEVKLSNFWEITFDLQFNVIDLDRDDD